jgi:TolB-like protein/Tfp pilus assembly protein PilF
MQLGQHVSDIFLSYSRDNQAIARKFADAFEGQGYSVWWDTTLRAGEAYDEVTEAALRGAKAVVVLWSPTSVASRWVRSEALLAYRNKTLVPAMIEPCERPIMFELTHTADMHGWKGNRSDPRWVALLRDVATLIEKNATREQETSAAPILASQSVPPNPAPNRRTLVLAGGVATLGLAGASVWAFRTAADRADEAKNSVAVLPFVNISGNSDQGFFADGLAAEVRAELASNPQLRVSAQTSSEIFKVRSDSIQTIARRLKVAFLLEGDVRKANQTARVNAKLIDGNTGFSVWVRTFDRPLDDIFAVQSEIAQAVVTALVSNLSATSKQSGNKGTVRKTTPGGTQNVVAFEAFLKGRALFESALSAQTDRQALEEFERAIGLDSQYAAAFAARARALSVIASQSGDPALMEVNRKAALASAQRAVELAPEFADGYSALGFILFTSKLDARSAKPAFEKSLQYGSGDGDVLTGYAMFSARTGQKEAAAQTIAKALERDPLNPTIYRSAGQIDAMARNYPASRANYQRALSMNPKMSIVHALIGSTYLFSGDLDSAKRAYSAEPNALFALPGLAIIDKKQGREANARATLARLISEHGDSGLYQQAQVYAGWGDKLSALTALERAYVVGDSGLAALFTDGYFDDFRDDPRFSQLLKSIGFV